MKDKLKNIKEGIQHLTSYVEELEACYKDNNFIADMIKYKAIETAKEISYHCNISDNTVDALLGCVAEIANDLTYDHFGRELFSSVEFIQHFEDL